MESRKTRSLDPAEAARLLRELADELESGKLRVGDGIALAEGTLKVKVSGKTKDDSASLLVKLQWKCSDAGGDEAPSTAEIPPYKSIKKRMGATIKKIRAQLREEGLPDLELAEQFDLDAELMLHYPKKGDAADIAAFRQTSASFLEAVQAGDLETVCRVAAALAAVEKSCHKKYK